MEESLALVPTTAAKPEKSPSKPKITLKQAKENLDAALVALNEEVQVSKVPRLQFNVQRWRVTVMVLKEREEGEPNPKVYNEMSLLARMAKQLDLDEDAEAEEQNRQQSAEEKLERAGVSVAGARAVIEMFTQLKSDAESPQSDPDPATGRD